MNAVEPKVFQKILKDHRLLKAPKHQEALICSFSYMWLTKRLQGEWGFDTWPRAPQHVPFPLHLPLVFGEWKGTPPLPFTTQSRDQCFQIEPHGIVFALLSRTQWKLTVDDQIVRRLVLARTNTGGLCIMRWPIKDSSHSP